MPSGWRKIMLIVGLGWLLCEPIAADAQLLPFAWRLRPKWMYHYGYHWGMDPYMQRYYDPNRKTYYFGGFYEYYGTDYADKLFGQGQGQQAEEPGRPDVVKPPPETVPVIYTNPASPPPEPVPASAKRAHVVVRVPAADAQVWFGGQNTGLEGLERSFRSPPLVPGREYIYDVRVRWRQDGLEKDESRSVQVQPGQELLIDFTPP
jgi:uncharacterized protein (TIGR03000 family)